MNIVQHAARRLTERFSQTRDGGDIELRNLERAEQLAEQVRTLKQFAYNPHGKARIRVRQV